MNMGRLYLLQGNWSKAETHLNAALPLYSQAGARANPNLIDAYCLQGLLHLEREEVEAALEWGERSLKLLQEVSDKEAGESAEWGRYEQLMGRIALAQGQLEAACDHLRRGKEIFQANRSHIEIGRTAYWQGMVWLALTEPGRAKTAFMEAERVFQQLGASADLERARRQLAELC
jgi:tetratricopeptide (TPR) repeat protein